MKEDNVYFSVRTKVIMFCLLIMLGLIFRYPTTPHEIGADSFAVHLMANSISEFGYAKWWLHPMSIIGSYPYSTTPSAVPFFLSALSQCISLDMELTIFIYSILLGLFCIFSAYLMAGVLWNNDIFKFSVAFAFSTFQGIIYFTTWTATGRTFFVILLPVFIYLLLKIHASKVRFGILSFIFSALLVVTHHYYYFLICIIISYFIVELLYGNKYLKSIRISENSVNIAILAGFIIMFLVPYFYRDLWWSDPEVMRSISSTGSIYTWISGVMLESYVRYIGLLIICAVGGCIYLIFKRNKKFEEWFLLLVLVSLTPFLYIVTYMKWFILPFLSLLVGLGLTNIAIINFKGRKYITSFLIILLLLSSCFSGYYQYINFLNDSSPYTRYMEETTYIGALWIKESINRSNNIIGPTFIGHKVFSTSGVPTLTGLGAADLAYGFVNPEELEVKQILSPYSIAYYFEDPYKAVNHTTTGWSAFAILDSDINNPHSWAYRLTYKFDLSYYVDKTDIRRTFAYSVQQSKDTVYDNGKIRIWVLK